MTRVTKLETPNAFEVAKAYAADVGSGAIVAGRFVRLACKRFEADLLRTDIRFDPGLAQHVIDYIAIIFASQGTELLPWQIFLVANLFGWVLVPSGLRRFRRAYIQVAKKSGKTTLCSALALYMADDRGDEEPLSEVYIAATNRAQAESICFRHAVRLQQENAFIKNRSRKWQYKITFAAGNNILAPLAANSEKLNGKNIHFGILDELSDHATPDLHSVFTSSTAGRRQPIIISITTSGEYRIGNIAWDERQRAAQVLENVVPGDSFFALIYEMDADDDPDNEVNWAKASPSLGILVPIEGVRDLQQEAKAIPSKRNSFLRFSLNVWPSQSAVSCINADDLLKENVAYLPGEKDLSPLQRIEKMEARLAIQKPTKPLSEYKTSELIAMSKTRPLFGGLDLAQTLDLSSFCLLAPPVEPNGIFEATFRNFCSEEQIEIRSRVGRVPYQQWAKSDKFLISTPGSVTDNEYIERTILDLHKKFSIKEIGVDRKYAEDLCRRLESQGVKVSILRQGWELSPAICFFQKLLATGRICLHGSPIVNWCCSNLTVVVGPITGDLRVDRARAREKIDCAVSLIMAMQIYMLQKPAAGKATIEYI